MQRLHVGPCLPPHADVLQVGVKSAGEAGSGSVILDKKCRHRFVCRRILVHAAAEVPSSVICAVEHIHKMYAMNIAVITRDHPIITLKIFMLWFPVILFYLIETFIPRVHTTAALTGLSHAEHTCLV